MVAPFCIAKEWPCSAAELEIVPVTVKAPAVIILLDAWMVFAITVPLNTAPAEEDSVPEHSIDVSLVKVAVPPITAADDPLIKPFDRIDPVVSIEAAFVKSAVERMVVFDPLKDDAAPADGTPRTTLPSVLIPRKLPGPPTVPEDMPPRSIAPETLRVLVITPPTNVAP